MVALSLKNKLKKYIYKYLYIINIKKPKELF